jgi:hypothetical protein
MYTVADPLGNLYTLTEDGAGGFVAALVDTHIGDVAQLVRDGRFGGPNGQGIVYGAGAPTLKLLNSTALYELDTITSNAIGYGALYVPPPSGWYLLIPQRAVVQAGVYQVWPDGNWTLHNAGLPNIGLRVDWVSANPLNSGEWLAVIHTNSHQWAENSGGKLVSSGSTYSPLWRWNGTQWEEVTISTSLSGTVGVERAEWDTETDGLWMVTARVGDHTAYLFRGNNTASTQEHLLGDGNSVRALLLIGAGVGGDTVLYQNYPEEYLLYADASGTLVEPSPNIGDIDVHFYGNRYPGASRAVALRADDQSYGGHIYVSADYRGSAAPTPVRAALSSKTPPAITIDEQLLVATATGVVRIVDPFGSPYDEAAAMTGLDVRWLHCDAQSRRMVAGFVPNAVHVWDSTTGGETEIDITNLNGAWAYVHVVTEA